MENPTPEDKRPPRIQNLSFALATNVSIQLPLIALVSLAFDGGFLGRMTLQAIIAYWLFVAWLAIRHGKSLRPVHAFMIWMGFLPWLVVTVAVEVAVQTLCLGHF